MIQPALTTPLRQNVQPVPSSEPPKHKHPWPFMSNLAQPKKDDNVKPN